MAKKKIVKEVENKLVVTEEVDLTKFNLSKRECRDFGTMIFSKKFGTDDLDDGARTAYSRCSKIVRSSETYVMVTEGYVQHCFPVINVVTKDFWDVNQGKPIHCTAIVTKLALTPRGQVELYLKILESYEEKPETKKINVIEYDFQKIRYLTRW